MSAVSAMTFEPQIVKKRQRRLSGVDEVVLSLLRQTGLPPVRFQRTSPGSTVRRSSRRRSAGSPTR